MPANRRLICFIATCSLFAFLHAAKGHDGEAEAAFAFKDGCVSVTLRQAGRPIDGAKIQVFDSNGKNFGSGETEADGEACCPLPTGASFVVEIKAGERTSDPIRLYKTETGIAPARVLVSYGLRPCCRSKGRDEVIVVGMPTEAPADSAPTLVPDWLVLTTITGQNHTSIELVRQFEDLRHRPCPEQSRFVNPDDLPLDLILEFLVDQQPSHGVGILETDFAKRATARIG